MLKLVCTDVEACYCSRVFPNEEMDLFATAVRQVARTLLAVHVTLQMGFEEEVWPRFGLHSAVLHAVCTLQLGSQQEVAPAHCFCQLVVSSTGIMGSVVSCRR